MINIKRLEKTGDVIPVYWLTFEFVTLVFSLVLIHLPEVGKNLSINGSLFRIAGYAPLWLVIIKYFVNHGTINIKGVGGGYFFSFFVIGFLGYWISSGKLEKGVGYSYLISYITLIMYSWAISSMYDLRTLLIGTLFALSISLLLNVVLYFLGIFSFGVQETGDISLHSYRVIFAFTDGVNNIGVISGLGFMIGAYFLFLGYRLHIRIFGLVTLFCALVVVFLSEIRAVIFFSLVTLAFVFYCGKSYFLSSYFAVFFSVLMGPILAFISLYFMSESDYLMRSTGKTILSDREFIWILSVIDISGWPILNLLFGYGAYGHYASGINYSFEEIIAGFDDPRYISVHNAFLQTFVDYGAIGIVAYIFIISKVIYMLSYELKNKAPFHKSEFNIVFILILGIVTMGATEVTFSYLNKDGFLLFLISVFGFVKNRKENGINAK